LAEVAADGVAPHRQRQPVLLVPPLAQVEHFVEPLRLVKKLSLMNQQPGVAVSLLNSFDNLVERNDYEPEVRIENSEGQEGAREFPWNSDFKIRNIIRRQRL